MRVLDFVQERCHETSPADIESVFINAGGSETRVGPGLKKSQESLGGIALFGSLETFWK